MSCVLKNLSIYGENALNIDKILRNLVDNRNVAPESSTYKQVKALLQLCSLDSADKSMNCLVKNEIRFGLRKTNIFYKLKMELTDLLNPTENISSCKRLISDPIYDPTDIFVSLGIKNHLVQFLL